MVLEIINYIISLFPSHPYLSPFIAGLIYEEVFLISTVLSSGHDIPLFFWFLFGYLGIITSDIFWFYFIKIKPLFKFSQKIGKERKKAISKTKIKNFPAPTTLKGFCITKTIFGLRSWGIFYCSVHKQPFLKFLRNVLIATAIWLIIFIPLGLLIGSTLYKIFEITNSAGLIIILVITLLIVWGLLSRFVLSRLSKK